MGGPERKGRTDGKAGGRVRERATRYTVREKVNHNAKKLFRGSHTASGAARAEQQQQEKGTKPQVKVKVPVAGATTTIVVVWERTKTKQAAQSFN